MYCLQIKQKLEVLYSNKTKTRGTVFKQNKNQGYCLQIKQKLEVLSSNKTKTRGTVFK